MASLPGLHPERPEASVADATAAARVVSADSYSSPKRFSFLVDQEYQRRRDEAALAAAEAAAAANQYKPGVQDYLLFIYFSINLFLIGNAFLNANAVLSVWRLSETFRGECQNIAEAADWCFEQDQMANMALLYYHAASVATSLMSGVLVDTFSAAMCLLIAHFLFCGGCHMLQSAVTATALASSTRHIFLSLILHGVAAELLLASVLPMSGLFPEHHGLMLATMSAIGDLSVLFYPLLLNFGMPTSPLASDHAAFLQKTYNNLFYYGVAAALIGTWLLPVDDDGSLMPVTTQKPNKKTVLMNALPILGGSGANVVPRGTLKPAVNINARALDAAASERDPLLTPDETATPDLECGEEEEAGPTSMPGIVWQRLKHRVRTFVSRGTRGVGSLEDDHEEGTSPLSARFSRQVRSFGFFAILVITMSCCIRNAFFGVYNRRLFELAGDVGGMAEAFSWLLGLGAFLGPFGWYLNDKYDCMVVTSMLVVVSLAINLLVFVTDIGPTTALQYLLALLFIVARCLLPSSVLTFTATVFGNRNFELLAVVLGFVGGFSCFLLVPIAQIAIKLGFLYANFLMVLIGLVAAAFLAFLWIFPSPRVGSSIGTLEGDDEKMNAKTEALKIAVGNVDVGDNEYQREQGGREPPELPKIIKKEESARRKIGSSNRKTNANEQDVVSEEWEDTDDDDEEEEA